jgi:hypothetical protein
MRTREEIESEIETKYSEGGWGQMGYSQGSSEDPTPLDLKRIEIELLLDIRGLLMQLVTR